LIEQLWASTNGGDDLDPGGAVLDGNHIYFAVRESANYDIEIRSITTDGLNDTQLVPPATCINNCYPATIAVDASEVFFFRQANAPTLYAVQKTPGYSVRTVGAFAPMTWPEYVSLVGSNVYFWQDDKGVSFCPKAGCSSPSVIGGGGSPASPAIIMRMTSSATALYWANRDTYVIKKLDVSGASPVLSTVGTPSVEPCDVATDGTLGYWVDCASPYQVYEQGGGVLGKEIAYNAIGATTDEYGSVALDASYVYFLEAGQLDRVPIGGGKVEGRAVVTDGYGGALRARIIGLDASYAYLQVQAGARIFRVAK
jgi:hypothetical protein